MFRGDACGDTHIKPGGAAEEPTLSPAGNQEGVPVAQAVLIAFALLILVGVLGTIARVGKPAKPVTATVAAWTTLIGILELAALAYVYSQF